jgi:hypothetical protein
MPIRSNLPILEGSFDCNWSTQIAKWVDSDYLMNMRFRTLRRWLALCAVVALSLGVAAHGFAAAEMDAEMMTAASVDEMSPSSSGCGGCSGGGDGMLTTGCFALCGGAVAVLPSFAPIKALAVEPAAPAAVRSSLGRGGPPDPYPPRPSILS